MNYATIKKHDISNGLGVRVALQGAMFGLLSLVAFFIGWKFTGTEEGGQTMAFMVLALCQIVQAFNMRSGRSLFKIGFFGNKQLNKAALVSLALVLLVLFTPISSIFGLVYLEWELYLIALGLILVPLPVMEIAKIFHKTI